MFEGLNFRFDTDSRVALVGPNGCGKSTLLKLLMRKVQPLDGEVEWSRDCVLGYYSQNFEILNEGVKSNDDAEQVSAMDLLMRRYNLREQEAR